MKTKEEHLYHFTSLPYLLNILYKKQLTLTNPKNWEDKNDLCFLERYKKIKGIRSLLTLCFTSGKEAFHLWKIYANGVSGVRIKFKQEQLCERIQQIPGIRYAFIQNKRLNDLRNSIPDVMDLPFLKRIVFNEKEWRIIYEDKVNELDTKSIDIDLSIVTEIALSPWLDDDVATSIEEVITKIENTEHIKFIKSATIKHKDWIKMADEAEKKYNGSGGDA